MVPRYHRLQLALQLQPEGILSSIGFSVFNPFVIIYCIVDAKEALCSKEIT